MNPALFCFLAVVPTVSIFTALKAYKRNILVTFRDVAVSRCQFQPTAGGSMAQSKVWPVTLQTLVIVITVIALRSRARGERYDRR
jgi:hypothetical protein